MSKFKTDIAGIGGLDMYVRVHCISDIIHPPPREGVKDMHQTTVESPTLDSRKTKWYHRERKKE